MGEGQNILWIAIVVVVALLLGVLVADYLNGLLGILTFLLVLAAGFAFRR